MEWTKWTAKSSPLNRTAKWTSKSVCDACDSYATMPVARASLISSSPQTPIDSSPRIEFTGYINWTAISMWDIECFIRIFNLLILLCWLAENEARKTENKPLKVIKLTCGSARRRAGRFLYDYRVDFNYLISYLFRYSISYSGTCFFPNQRPAEPNRNRIGINECFLVISSDFSSDFLVSSLTMPNCFQVEAFNWLHTVAQPGSQV